MTTEVQETKSSLFNRKLVKTGAVLALIFVCAAFAGVYGREWWLEHRTGQYRQGCKQAVAQKRWKELDKIARAWRNWDPLSDDSLLFQAEAASQLGDPQRAADLLGQVSVRHKRVLEALAFRAEILFGDLNLPYAAEETWQRMLSINREATLPRQRLIYFYAMTLQRQKMVRLIREGIEIGCEPPEAYAYLLLANNLNFTDGYVVVHNWRKNYPNDRLLEIAEAIYAGRNKYDGDETVEEKSDVAPGDQDLINVCLQKYPNDLEVVSYHIEKKVYDGDTAGIVDLLKQAPPEAADDSRFWRYRGWLLREQNRLEKAREALEKSLELDPFNWHARYELSNVLRLQGDLDAASRESETAVLGKRIERKLFESPNALTLERPLIADMIRFMDAVGERDVADAFRRRTGM